VSDPNKRSAHLPADLITLLVLPAFMVLTLLVGPQRLWMVLLLIGLLEIAMALSLLRGRRFSPSGWLTLVIGVGAASAGGFFALTVH
jgi:hypothetical protein